MGISLLMESGAILDLVNLAGESSLYWAVYSGDPTTVNYLLEYGADPWLATSPKGTPCEVGLDSANDGIVSIFQKLGPRPDAPPSTPFPTVRSLASDAELLGALEAHLAKNGHSFKYRFYLDALAAKAASDEASFRLRFQELYQNYLSGTPLIASILPIGEDKLTLEWSEASQLLDFLIHNAVQTLNKALADLTIQKDPILSAAAASSSFSGPSDLSSHLSSSSSSSSSNNNNSTTIINENELSPSSSSSSDPDTSEPEPGVSGPISGACLSISFSCSSLIEPPSTLAEDEQPEHTAAPEREPAAECPPTCLCSNAPIGPHSFEIVKFLGRGSCGEVYLVRRTSCRTKQELFFAMKVLTKKQILQQNKVGRVLMEQEILMLANSPYVVKLFYSFQTEDFLHFVIELCIGGTLFRLVKGQPNSRISEEFVRFYAAEVCLALEHLHSVGYVHRDIKPENLLICENGHLKLADFDLSANIAETTHHPSASRRPRLSSFVGTPDYLSPEVVHGGSQSYVLDFWSLGVLIFEMLFGSSPFITSPTSRSSSISFRFVIPPEPRISSQCRSLIQALLQPADKRIGRRAGVSEIKNHPWFDGVDWSTVDQIQAPFDPRSYLTSPTDTRYFRNTHQRQLSRSYYESPMLTEILPASDPFYPFLLLSSPILASELPSDPSFVTPDALSQRTGTLHCGPMHKQGYFRKNWKKRWFVLSAERGGRCLKYYNSQSSMKLVDQIDVATVTEVAPGDVQRFSVSANNLPPDAKMEFLFHLISPSRVYHFICPSLQEREEWINILINLISIPLPS